MKIAYREHGGFVGGSRAYEIDDAQLSEADARELRELIEAAAIHSSFERHSRNARDAVLYEIELDTDFGHYHVAVDEVSMPEALVPLIEYLSDRAKPRPPL